MAKCYIGIDNGVSGTIAIIGGSVSFERTPVIKVQDYTKKKKLISRLDGGKFYEMLKGVDPLNTFLLLERPLVNPTRFTATTSALRCHEAMLIVIELLKIPYAFIDSKEWQKEMFPKGFTDGDTKRFSLNVGNRLFPQFSEHKHPDRDSLLIAEYAKRKGL